MNDQDNKTLEFLSDALDHHLTKKSLKQYSKWIKKIAREYRYTTEMLEYEDLISVGENAVFIAENSYDPEKGTKISTHVMNGINFAIVSAAKQGTRFKKGREEQMAALRAAIRLLGEDATSKELSDYLKEKYSCSNLQLSEDTVNIVKEYLDLKVFNINETTYEEIFEEDYEEKLDFHLKKSYVIRNMRKLDRVERKVIRGIFENLSMTEIASRIGKARPSVNYFYEKAIKKLQKDLVEQETCQ